jgi:hypothetical protein
LKTEIDAAGRRVCQLVGLLSDTPAGLCRPLRGKKIRAKFFVANRQSNLYNMAASPKRINEAGIFNHLLGSLL